MEGIHEGPESSNQVSDAEHGRQQLEQPATQPSNQMAMTRCISNAMRIWAIVILKSISISLPIIIFIWIYFLPALILGENLRNSLKPFLYEKFLIVIRYPTYYGFMAIYGVSTFGFQICMRPVFFVLLPSSILSVYLDLFVQNEWLELANDLGSIFFSIYLVHAYRPPTNSGSNLQELVLRKNEITGPLAKMIVVIFAVYTGMSSVFLTVIQLNYQGILLLRLIILPITITCCSSLQMYFLKSLPKRYTECAVPVIWISNGMLKILERILTNIIFGSGGYDSFVYFAILACCMEMTNHMSYFYKLKLIKMATVTFKKLNQNQKSTRKISVIPAEENSGRLSHYSTSDMAWLIEIRKRLIVEDITLEIIMAIVVTFMLYMIDPLAEDDRFGTISSFVDFFIQIIIQLLFEMISDVFGLYWSLRYHHIGLIPSDIKLNDRWGWLWFSFVLYVVLRITYFILIP
eukprot:TRINITY_DN18984_c0_g1_i1.p1 TRINITY_DN18984_c0_g1~~TRINITY_DN18984_c0_g1_i1.p1  ORF type:complete len:461 (-),score=51.22 TRINITY_DN18984_c0_g1_i1:104-1486(-)